MTTAHTAIQTTPSTDARPLSGRVAVVTGTSSGIGAATARRLASDGAAVALLGRRTDRQESLAAELTETGAPARPFTVDVTDRAALRGSAERITAELGRVDLVVANAGVMLGAPFERADTVEWDQMVNTNISGLLNTDRAFVEDLLAVAADGGRADLVHVGSIASYLRMNDYAVYCATKAAVNHLTNNLRTELGPRGVRVKNVEPGIIETELGAGMRSAANRSALAEWRQDMRALEPSAIADAIAYAAAAPVGVNVAEMIVLPTPQG